MTTDDLTPPGESTTEYQALMSSHVWATILKVCGIITVFGGIALGIVTQFASSNPSNTGFAMLAVIIGGLKFVSGAILKASTTNTYISNRTDLKGNALDVIQATLPAPKAGA